MAVRISVSVTGLTGMDDSDRMLGELEAATGLSWRPRTVDKGKVLSGGIVEILLEAVVAKAVEMSVEAAVDAARKVVERWRSERLDPPETSVDTEVLPEPDADTTVVLAADGLGG